MKEPIGHFLFNGNKIPFYSRGTGYNRIYYLVDEKYTEIVKETHTIIGSLYEDIYRSNSDSNYINCYIKRLYLTTNFADCIEISFKTNVNIQEMRDIKINLLINE